MFSSSNNSVNTATGTKVVPVGPADLVPVAVFTELFDNENLWYI